MNKICKLIFVIVIMIASAGMYGCSSKNDTQPAAGNMSSGTAPLAAPSQTSGTIIVNNGEKTDQKTDNDSRSISFSNMTVYIPSVWTERGSDEELLFDDENKKTVAGIFIVGYYGNIKSVLPNHSEIISEEDLKTDYGNGKLMTIKTDSPAASGEGKPGYEIHMLIPIDKQDMAYDIWATGQDKAILLSMLQDSLQ